MPSELLRLLKATWSGLSYAIQWDDYPAWSGVKALANITTILHSLGVELPTDVGRMVHPFEHEDFDDDEVGVITGYYEETHTYNILYEDAEEGELLAVERATFVFIEETANGK